MIGRPTWRFFLLVFLAAVLAAVTTGCAHRVWNDRLAESGSAERYEFRTRLPKNSEEVFVVLAFSGGGTRAASFSYGVLEALRDTEVTVDGKSAGCWTNWT